MLNIDRSKGARMMFIYYGAYCLEPMALFLPFHIVPYQHPRHNNTY